MSLIKSLNCQPAQRLNSDWLFITLSKVLQDDWLMLDYHEKATLCSHHASMIRESQPPTAPAIMYWALIRANDPMILSSHRYGPIKVLNLMSEMIIILNYIILNDEDLHCSQVNVGSDEPSCPKRRLQFPFHIQMATNSDCDFDFISKWPFYSKIRKKIRRLPHQDNQNQTCLAMTDLVDFDKSSDRSGEQNC